LADLLGLRFSPRIKDLPDQRLYRSDKQTHYRTVEPLLKGTVHNEFILDRIAFGGVKELQEIYTG